MDKNNNSILEKILDLEESKRIVIATRKTPEKLLKYADKKNITVILINPEETDIIKQDNLIQYQEYGISKLSQLTDYDIVILDEDPNWYTTYTQLKIIEKENQKFPITIIKNIHLTKDQYFDKNIIPLEYQEKNGVKTAINDFINESSNSYKLISIGKLKNTGILIDEKDQNIIEPLIEKEDPLKKQIRIIEKTIETQNKIQELEDELEKLNDYKKLVQSRNNRQCLITYNKQDTIIGSILPKIELPKNIQIYLDEEEYISNINQTTGKFKLIIPLKYQNGQTHELTVVDFENNNILCQKSIKIANHKPKTDKRILNELNKNQECIYESQYFQNHHRSLKSRLIGKLYPINLLLHFKQLGGIKNALLSIKGYNKIKKDNLLDIGYYLRRNNKLRLDGMDPVTHYIIYGYKEGQNPNRIFDGQYYMDYYKDVQKSNLNPLVHYILYGINENRKITTKSTQQVKTGFNEDIKDIRGNLQSSDGANMILGWVAKIDNKQPRTAAIIIDGEKHTIIADKYRSDLKNNNINNGEHAFEFKVPKKFITGTKHYIQLLDNETGKILDSAERTWTTFNYENNFSRYLSNSLTSPITHTPFTQQDKKIFSVMNNISKYLLKQVPNNKPLVSIIMPVYNRVNLVQRSIDSVLNQTYNNIELIIVDDGSSDGTIQLLKNQDDPRIKIKYHDHCQGASQARNTALNMVKGKYIMYLDSDNTWDERYVSCMVGAFNLLSDAEVLYSGQIIYEGKDTTPKFIRFGALNKGLVKNNNYIDLNAFCHTKEVYDKLGGFDTSLKRFVDWDLILNYTTHATTYGIPTILSNYYYDIADNSLSNNTSYAKYLDIVRNKHEKRLKKISYNINIDHNVSIIIPSYESLSDLKECVNSITNLNLDWIEIIIVDNNSSTDVTNYLKDLKKKNIIKLILNKFNYGFTYAVMQGINISKPGNDIVLLNNDAIITPNSIELLQDAAYKLPNCAITVPQQVLPANTNTIKLHVPFANEKQSCDVNISNHHKNIIDLPLFSNGKYTKLNFAPFFCVYIKRDVYDNSIGLDAELGRHYRSDMIFCNYVREVMNLDIFHVSESIVYHKLQKSTADLQNSDNESFDLLFNKNQWDENKMKELGYNKFSWDMDNKE
ncbi:MAG: glycosyltransferase [Methanobacteriaceae archaeon]|nr:glycosyltransferase [Methanobacteriaceae archaeon]